MITIGFWASLLVVLHTYLVFPLVVLVRGRTMARPYQVAPVLPSVAVVIAAHNEETAIRAKLATVTASDYPPERMQIVVASDGSTDATVAEALGGGDPRVRCLDLPRVGKAAALNQAVDACDGAEVVVFTDANSLLEPRALRALVAPFADQSVGGVAGDQRYLPPGADGPDHAHGERTYWDFDRQLKQAQSAAGNVIGATGALYAMRRELVPQVLEGVTDDFTTSTNVIACGRRLVFSPDAVAWEPVAASTGDEFDRKVRVMTRGLRSVLARRELLDPRRSGFYAYQMATQKLVRRLMAIPMLTLAASALVLSRRPLPRAVAVASAGLGLAATAGLAAPETKLGRSRPCRLAAYFAMVNGAGLLAAVRVARGDKVLHWETQRAEGSGPR